MGSAFLIWRGKLCFIASSIAKTIINNMLQNLILDIGNVICDWNPDALAAMSFDDPEQQQEALSVTVHTADWLELDKGTMTVEQAIERAMTRTKLDAGSIAKIYANLGKSLTALPGTMAAMRHAKQAGVPIYILSNMQKNAWEYLDNNHDCWDDCAGVVVSCDTGFIKPEPQIFQYLCDKFSITAASCVFVDDMADNIAAAKAYGFEGVQLLDKQEGGRVVDELVGRIVAARG